MRTCGIIKILNPPGTITLRPTHEDNKTRTQEDQKTLTHLDINTRTVTHHQDLKTLTHLDINHKTLTRHPNPETLTRHPNPETLTYQDPKILTRQGFKQGRESQDQMTVSSLRGSLLKERLIS